MELELNSQDWNVNANELEPELELKDMKRTLELLDESKSMVHNLSLQFFTILYLVIIWITDYGHPMKA